METLAGAGDHAAFHHLNHTVRKEFAVDAQILVVGQVLQDRVRNAADAHLQGRAVGDQTGDVLSHLEMNIRTAALHRFRDRIINFDDRAQPAQMDETVAQRAGHLAVYLGDDGRGCFGCRLGRADLDTKAAETVFIRRREGNQRGIQRQRATLAEKTGNLTQKNRCEISPAFIDSLAHVATDEEGIGAKRLAKFSAGIRRFRESQDMDKFDVAQFGRPSGQRFRQLHRYACAAAEIDATA